MSFEKVLSHIDRAEDQIKEAQASLVPTNRMKVSDAYVLGSLKVALTALEMCKTIVKTVVDTQSKKPELRSENPPLLHE